MAEPIAIGWPECATDGLTLIWDSVPIFIRVQSLVLIYHVKEQGESNVN